MIWWLIRILFFAAFIVLEIRLSKSSNRWLGLITPAAFSLASVLIYVAWINELSIFGVALDNVIAFAAIAILLMVVYFYCRFNGDKQG